MKRRGQPSTSSKTSSSPNWFAGFPWLLFKRCFGLALYPLEKIDEAAKSAKYIFKKIILPKLICRIPVVTLQKMFWSCTVPLRKNWWSGEVSEVHLQKIMLPKLICRIPVVTLQKMFWFCTVPLRKNDEAARSAKHILKKSPSPNRFAGFPWLLFKRCFGLGWLQRMEPVPWLLEMGRSPTWNLDLEYIVKLAWEYCWEYWKHIYTI